MIEWAFILILAAAIAYLYSTDRILSQMGWALKARIDDLEKLIGRVDAERKQSHDMIADRHNRLVDLVETNIIPNKVKHENVADRRGRVPVSRRRHERAGDRVGAGPVDTAQQSRGSDGLGLAVGAAALGYALGAAGDLRPVTRDELADVGPALVQSEPSGQTEAGVSFDTSSMDTGGGSDSFSGGGDF